VSENLYVRYIKYLVSQKDCIIKMVHLRKFLSGELSLEKFDFLSSYKEATPVSYIRRFVTLVILSR
jgi:hypothetical protein